MEYIHSLRTGIMAEYPVMSTSQGPYVRIEQTSEAIRVTYEMCRVGGARTGIENRCIRVYNEMHQLMKWNRQWVFHVFSVGFLSDLVYCSGFPRKVVFSQGWAGLCVAQGQHTAEVMFTAHSQGKAAHLLRWSECVSRTLSHPSGPVPALPVTWPDVGLKPGHSGWSVRLWIFHGRCWATHVWNNDKNKSSSNTCW